MRNQNTSNNGGTSWGSLGGTPITTGFMTVVVVALLVLFAARHLFGNVRIEGGTR